MLKDRFLWIDGKFLAFDRAQVHIFSHSFGRGSAIFEVISVHQTDLGVAVFRLEEHLDRLKRGADALFMTLPYSKKALLKVVHKTVGKNKVKNGLVKIIAYYPGIAFEVIPKDTKVSVAIGAFEIGRDISLSKLGENQFAKASVSRWRKLHPLTVPVFAKASGNYLNPMLAKLEVKKQGFSAPVLLDTNGYIAEGATESVFLVKRGKLFTPLQDNILPSITRMSVIELAKDLGIPIKEKRLKTEDLFNCDEAFFSSSTCKLWPIIQIEKRKLKAPGPVSQRLKDYFDRVLSGKIKRYHKWLSIG